MKKILVSLGFFIFIFYILSFTVFSNKVFAAGEFAASYNIHYDIDSLGVATVTEGVTLKNLTDQYYASNFTLDISATDISDIKATDSQGTLVTEVVRNGNKSKITVRFNQQIVGKDKEYVWSLQFKSKDFAEKNGNVWQVSIPKFAGGSNLENFNLSLSVPTSFGDPSVITPDPIKQNESGGKINFFFSKDQLLKSGILATFGQEQLFSFNLKYQVQNNGILPELVRLPLPPDTAFQKVVINSINPKPDNVVIDQDGNYIGIFKIDKKESKEINISGDAKVYINPQYPTKALSDSQKELYTREQEYWQKDNPQVKNKLTEIFKNGKPKTNLEQAKKIYDYVSTALTYDEKRLNQKNYERLGALTTLSNPKQALCQEFSDLFVTLARAAGIPARQLVGYAFSNNNNIRPLSFNNTELHSWVEFYDPRLGWLMVDPTWGNTTGGVDYFSKFDLSHLVLAIHGESSVNPIPADNVKVSFSNVEFQPKPDLKVSVAGYKELYSGIPGNISIVFENQGNSVTMPQEFTIQSNKLNLIGLDNKATSEKKLLVSEIPPFGNASYKFDLRATNLWQSGEEIIKITSKDQSIEYSITIKPFFKYKYFSLIVLSLIGGMFLVYLLTIFIHFKMHRQIHKIVKKAQHKK